MFGKFKLGRWRLRLRGLEFGCGGGLFTCYERHGSRAVVTERTVERGDEDG